MSAREFSLEERKRLAALCPSCGGCCVETINCQTCGGTGNRCDAERRSQPSAQPHVAAGEGWRERMKKAIENARDLSYVLGCVEERNESTSEMADAKADDVDFQVTIDALIAEVVELPPIPETFTVPNGGKSLAEVFGPEYAEQMAAACLRDAALVRAATSSDPSA